MNSKQALCAELGALGASLRLMEKISAGAVTEGVPAFRNPVSEAFKQTGYKPLSTLERKSPIKKAPLSPPPTATPAGINAKKLASPISPPLSMTSSPSRSLSRTDRKLDAIIAPTSRLQKSLQGLTAPTKMMWSKKDSYAGTGSWPGRRG